MSSIVTFYARVCENMLAGGGGESIYKQFRFFSAIDNSHLQSSLHKTEERRNYVSQSKGNEHILTIPSASSQRKLFYALI